MSDYEDDFDDEDYDEEIPLQEEVEKKIHLPILEGKRGELNSRQLALRKLEKELKNYDMFDSSSIEDIINILINEPSILHLNSKSLAAALIMYYKPDELDIEKLDSDQFEERFDIVEEQLLKDKTDIFRAKSTMLRYLKLYDLIIQDQSV
ncbi:unnamed protein product [marine sediment metagenome]|uniref:Uncharacterized protein n=1 Tax=marine sediment metagenome TaxID=412755 RepID=X1HI32_9ZZZZ